MLVHAGSNGSQVHVCGTGALLARGGPLGVGFQAHADIEAESQRHEEFGGVTEVFSGPLAGIPQHLISVASH